MKDFKKSYKKYYDEIDTSNEFDKKIFSNTINKEDKFLYRKKIICVPLIILICLLSTCIVFADELKHVAKTYWSLYITPNSKDDDLNQKMRDLYVTNLKEINYDANINEVPFYGEEKINRADLEEKLNTKFLTSDNILNDEITIFKLTKTQEHKISNAELVIKNAFQVQNTKNSYIYMKIQFITKYYNNLEKGFVLIRDYMPYGTENWVTIKYSEKLNTDIYIQGDVQNIKNDYISSWLDASFVYDNVGYTLRGNNLSINMMMNIINSLSY